MLIKAIIRFKICVNDEMQFTKFIDFNKKIYKILYRTIFVILINYRYVILF